MNRTSMIAASAVASVVASAALAATAVPAPNYNYEKCYGVNAPLKNDCAVKGVHSCGAESKMPNDPQSWIYVPVGTCAKIQGGSTSPKA